MSSLNRTQHLFNVCSTATRFVNIEIWILSGGQFFFTFTFASLFAGWRFTEGKREGERERGRERGREEGKEGERNGERERERESQKCELGKEPLKYTRSRGKEHPVKTAWHSVSWSPVAPSDSVAPLTSQTHTSKYTYTHTHTPICIHVLKHTREMFPYPINFPSLFHSISQSWMWY